MFFTTNFEDWMNGLQHKDLKELKTSFHSLLFGTFAFTKKYSDRPSDSSRRFIPNDFKFDFLEFQDSVNKYKDCSLQAAIKQKVEIIMEIANYQLSEHAIKRLIF